MTRAGGDAVTRARVALTIAGSDSGGGAGVQADLKTFSALGVYGATVITALTAQNTLAVTAIHDPPVAIVVAQLDAVLADLAVDAIKIGMLSEPEVVRAVAARLRGAGGQAPFAGPVVVDPVMVSKSGAPLLSDEAVVALREVLLPGCTVLTPNLPEAAALLGEDEAAVRADPERACRRLYELGPLAVVLKGGHAGGDESTDLLFDGKQVTRLPAARIATRHTHGTGCTFSAAIAALLAGGAPLAEAVAGAKRYLHGAIAAAEALGIGHGHGPVHHFHQMWPPPSP